MGKNSNHFIVRLLLALFVWLATAVTPLSIFIHNASVNAASIVKAQTPSQALRDIEYARVGNKSLKLDLYLPEGQGPFPLIIWVHGGGWTSGDKSLSANSSQIRQTTRGYAVASVNYRLSQEAKFPAQIEDCKAAVRWLRANATQYNVDPSRVAAWGSSAGGHLVALMGTSAGEPRRRRRQSGLFKPRASRS